MEIKNNKAQRFFPLFNLLIVLAMLVVIAGTVFPVHAEGPGEHPHSGFYLASVKPEKVLVNSADTTLTLKGSGFLTGATVLWEITSELTPTLISDRSLQVLIPASMLTVPGVFHLAVKNPDGTISKTRLFKVFVIHPKISRLNPGKVFVEANAAGQTFQLLVYGKNFQPDAVVNWYDPITLVTTPLTKVNDCTPTLCTVSVDKALIAVKNTIQITVANGTDISKPAKFKVMMPKPILTSMDPASAAAGSPALTLNLTGEYFTADSIINWGKTALAGPVTFTDAQHISIEVPVELLANPGKFPVSVSYPTGERSKPKKFIVTGVSDGSGEYHNHHH
jgi:hypothetical protein